jgi:FkbM family methyltransferase
MSKSQLNQDINVLNFYNHKHNGFFVEIGASDGINLSNTYLLEKEFNWRGICVEPIPHNFHQLVENRSNSICSNEAVYNESNIILEFDVANECNLFSGISTHIDCHKWRVDSNKYTIQVRTISLNDLLDRSGAPEFIEYLSLDTEGSEYEILRTFHFHRYRFGLIDVEHNHVEPRRSQIRDLLISNGYIYLGANQWDDCYKHHTV